MGYPSWYRVAKTFARRRMDNPEQNDESLVAITLAEQYRAQDALTRIDRLADMGIYAITTWSLRPVATSTAGSRAPSRRRILWRATVASSAGCATRSRS